jgi:hypothetical protein
MTNRRTEKQTTRGSNPQALAAKKIQAIDAARVQTRKMKATGPNAAVANGRNTHSTSSRRSTRLNKITAVVSSPVNSGRGHAGNMNAQMARDEGAQSHTQGSLDEVQDLKHQLEEERREPFYCTSYETICFTNNVESEKNRLLRRATEKQMLHTSTTIAKPKGSIGTAGFSLITAMKLDRHNPKDKALYNDILVSCKAL